MMICLGVCLCSNLQMYRSMKSDIGRQGIQCFVPFFFVSYICTKTLSPQQLCLLVFHFSCHPTFPKLCIFHNIWCACACSIMTHFLPCFPLLALVQVKNQSRWIHIFTYLLEMIWRLTSFMMCSFFTTSRCQNWRQQKETTILLDLLILAFFMKPTNPISTGGVLFTMPFSFSNWNLVKC